MIPGVSSTVQWAGLIHRRQSRSKHFPVVTLPCLLIISVFFFTSQKGNNGIAPQYIFISSTREPPVQIGQPIQVWPPGCFDLQLLTLDGQLQMIVGHV